MSTMFDRAATHASGLTGERITMLSNCNLTSIFRQLLPHKLYFASRFITIHTPKKAGVNTKGKMVAFFFHFYMFFAKGAKNERTFPFRVYLTDLDYIFKASAWAGIS
jgi:hypothetical protein